VPERLLTQPQIREEAETIVGQWDEAFHGELAVGDLSGQRPRLAVNVALVTISSICAE